MTKILIVDDSKFSRGWIKGVLREHGYDLFVEASNGIDALSRYLASKPDVVILDITLPRFNGITVLKGLLKVDPKANVVMYSSMSTRSNIESAMKYGAKGFVIKPNLNDVVDVVDQIVASG